MKAQVLEPVLPCTDPEDAQETIEEHCVVGLTWVPTTLPGLDASWFWCMPPAGELIAAPLSTPTAFKERLHQELCVGLGVCQSCWPPSMRTDDGLAQVYKWWMVNALVTLTIEENSDCTGLTELFNLADSVDGPDLGAVASATGITVPTLRVELAAAWFEQHGAAWATSAGGSFCTEVSACLPGVLGFTPTAAQFTSVTASVAGSIGSCGYCGNPGGGASDRWGDVEAGDQDGDGVSWGCTDLSSLLTSSLACYPPPGEAGAMTRDDVIALTAEYIAAADAAGPPMRCTALVGCLEEWLVEAMPSGGPLLQAELLLLLSAGDDCDIILNPFPPDFIEDPEGAAYGLWDEGACGFCGVGPGPLEALRTLTCNNPDLWIMPVDLRYGHKVERETDLALALSSGSYALTRTYRSEPGWTPEPLSGEKWSLSAFARAKETGTTVQFGSNTGLQAMAPISTTTGPLATVDGTPLLLAGRTHQTVQATQLCVGDRVVPTYRVREPGGWEIDYYRMKRSTEEPSEALEECAEDVEEPDDALVGLPVRWADEYGNARHFEYIVFPTSEAPVARLSRIVFTPAGGVAPDDIEAEVRFVWILDQASADLGRLRSVVALRWTGGESSTAVPIARTDYLYFDDVIGASPDLGSSGDLVQVTRSERIDPAPGASSDEPVWYRRITQYRYHGGTGASSGVNFGERDFTWVGAAHQLKMVIGPQQIEYLAARSGLGAPSTRLELAAAGILTQPDDGDAIESELVLIVDLASKIIEAYEPSGERRVLVEYSQSSCGCSVASGTTQPMRYIFDYWSYGEPVDLWTTRVREEYFDSGMSTWLVNRTTYIDMAQVGPAPSGSGTTPTSIIRHAVIVDSDAWVTAIEYDSATGLPELAYLPSNLPTYTPGTDSTAPSYTVGTTGMAQAFTYNGAKRRTQHRLVDVAEDESYIVTRTTWGDDSPVPSWLPVKIERFRVETTDSNPTPGADDVEITELAYQFHDGTTTISVVETKTEWDGAAFNGPSTDFVYTHELFDAQGRRVWSRAADGALTRREFSARTGGVTLVERNAEPPGSWDAAWNTGSLNGSFTGLNTSGGSLTTEMSYDLVGRLQSQTSSAGVTSYVRRELRECGDHPGLEYLAVISLPPELGEDDHTGPASIAWVDASGASMASWQCAISGEYELGSGDEPWPQAVTNYSIHLSTESLLARSSVVRNIAGQVTSTTSWNAPSGHGPDGGKATTRFAHDFLGRHGVTISAVGTATRQTFDAFGRVVATEIGLAHPTNHTPLEWTMSVVAEYEFDAGGVGNGLLTSTTAHVDGSTTRVTNHTYDWRDRLVMTENPLAPHSAQLYDNLDRVVASATFSTLPGSVPSSFDGADATRVSLQRTTYTQRGLVARSEVAIDPTEDDAGQAFLSTNQWYDEVGRTVGVWAPNSPGRKTTFDGLGRATAEYLTDRGGDVSPGAGSHADVWSDSTRASVLSDDKVLDQTEYRYITANGPRKGLLDLVRHRERIHDTSATGALGSSTAVTSFRGLFYDIASRVTHSVDYGTNDTTNHQFVSGTSDPTITQGSPPANGPNALVTQTIYDPFRGLATTTVRPGGRIDRTIVDALGRSIATVENEVGDPVTLAWNSGSQSWTVSNASEENDEDRVTTFVHNGIGQLVKMTAIANGETTGGVDQVTEYIHGVSNDPEGPDPFVSSSIFSNDLLLKIIYPPGEGSSTLATRTVFYGYNRQGEIVAMVDQNETLHEYERDALGRMTRDTATATASNIDATIDRIDLSFDSAGRLSKVTSLESAGPTVRNEVEFGYTPLGQVEKVYQHSKGAVSYDGGGLPTGDTRLVGYEYANAEIGSSSTGNFSRQTGLAYPRKVNSSGHDPEVLEYAFGTSGGTDDRISRVNQFKFNLTSSTNTSMVNYAFVGVGRTILVDLDQPDVQLDFTLSLDGKRRTVGYTTQTQGFYPGFDQFGRLALQTWADGGLTSASSLPTKPQIVALQYGYDDRGNRTAVLDVRRGNLWNRSHTYTNDGLDRLKKARRNTWANLISGSPVDGVGTQSWDLDLLGNWNEFQSWAPGSPPAPETETRTHNAVNELLTRTLPNSGPEHTLGYDAAGNMATDAVTSGNTTIYTHDAWNRLVKVEVDDGTTVVTKLEQEFNGLTWRTLKREDTPGSGAGLDEERTYAYTASWQLLEERVDADYSGDPGLDKRVQYAWGLRYIDDCLMHRADLNNDGDYADSGENTWYHMTDGMFSTVAVLNRTATLVERVSYDSYGQARHHRPGDVNGDGNSGFTDSALVGTIIVANGGTPVPITSSLYRAEADLNRDGTINSSDRTLAGVSASALASGLISNSGTGGPDNSIGWDGYVFNPAVGDYLVRHRTYGPDLGRWRERDPIGYSHDLSLYSYCLGRPIWFTDSRGLAPDQYGLRRDDADCTDCANGLRLNECYCVPQTTTLTPVGRDPVEYTKLMSRANDWIEFIGVVQAVGTGVQVGNAMGGISSWALRRFLRRQAEHFWTDAAGLATLSSFYMSPYDLEGLLASTARSATRRIGSLHAAVEMRCCRQRGMIWKTSVTEAIVKWYGCVSPDFGKNFWSVQDISQSQIYDCIDAAVERCDQDARRQGRKDHEA
ncbi:MAG: hypothetical protein KF724_13300 [Phycisphaeraceae bacterium]|nr:hypothetical protein [Phycisphaeraceae bacterium]